MMELNILVAIIAFIYVVIANIYIIKYYRLKDKIIEIFENKPVDNRKQSRALKFSDELDPYIKEDGDKISIKVVKNG